MEKMKKTIAILILLIFPINLRAEHCGTSCWHNPEQRWPNYTHSCYESSDEAIAAFNAECPGQTMRELGFECWRAKYGDGQYPKHYWYPGPDFSTCCADAQDSDGDGIPDSTDPFPNDSSAVQCAKVHWQTTPSQVIIWEKWKCTNTNGDSTFVEFGTRDPDEDANRVTTSLGQSWVDGSEILGGSGSGDLSYADKTDDGGSGSVADGGTTIETGSGTTATGTGSGTDIATGDTADIIQQKTTTNTARTADNTKVGAELQAETNKKLDDSKELLSEIVRQLREADKKLEREKGSFEHDSTGHFTPPDTSQYEDVEMTSKLDELSNLYKDRFELFIDNLKNASFISQQLGYLDNLPNSTDSVIEVDIGLWGNEGQQQAAIDLSAYSASFQVMKTILLVVCGFFCIRIILLKKG